MQHQPIANSWVMKKIIWVKMSESLTQLNQNIKKSCFLQTGKVGQNRQN